MVKFRRAIIAILLAVFAASAVAAIWIDASYWAKLPSAPDEQSGRTYRIVVSHGFVRYGSWRQLWIKKTIDELSPIAGFVFLAAVLLGLVYGDIRLGPTGRGDK